MYTVMIRGIVAKFSEINSFKNVELARRQRWMNKMCIAPAGVIA